jgi:hypothetical protein
MRQNGNGSLPGAGLAEQPAEQPAEQMHDFLVDSPSSPDKQRPVVIPTTPDFFAWRMTRRIFIARSDEDGNAADWRRMLRNAGIDVMTEAYDALMPTLKHPKHKVGFRAITDWISERYTITEE